MDAIRNIKGAEVFRLNPIWTKNCLAYYLIKLSTGNLDTVGHGKNAGNVIKRLTPQQRCDKSAYKTLKPPTNQGLIMKITLKTITGLASLAGLLIANPAFSANLILNPDFSTGDLTGWTPLGVTSGATITVNPTGGNPGDYAWLNNTLEGYNVGLSQATANGSAVGAGLTVTYSFDLLGGNQAAGGVDFIHIFDENSTGGVISQGPGLLGPYFPSASGWTTYTGSFTTVAGSDHLYIEFDASTGANLGSMDQMGVDNVVLSLPVPEPASLSLAAMGLLGVWTLRRSRKA